MRLHALSLSSLHVLRFMLLTSGIAALLIALLFVLFSARSADAVEIFVVPTTTPDAPGTRGAPMSFDGALTRASSILRSSGVPAEGLTITLRGGRYRFERAFVLGPEWRGTPERSIVIRAEPGAEVWFDGSVRFESTQLSSVTEPAEVARLAASAAGKVVAMTVDDDAAAARLSSSLMLGLTIDGAVHLPAVFPNDGYARLDGRAVVPEVTPPGIPPGQRGRAGLPPHQEPGRKEGWRGSLSEPRGAHARFGDRGDEMAGSWEQWERELARDNTRNALSGYVEANWLLSAQPLVAANAEERSVHLSRVLAYGWAWRRNDKQFRVYGLLCELDRPGEWHFDPLSRRLFLYPPTPLTAETSIGLATASGFLRLDDTAHLSVIGLSVENVGAGVVYDIRGGHHVTIAGCTVRNSSARGFEIRGEHQRVLACDLVDLNSHVALRGGRRSPTEITPGHNRVENCHIYQKNFRHRRVSASVTGVGNRFANNLIHNSFGQAMTVNGNDHVIERNEFFNVGYDEGDGGAIYAGADLTGYGVVYRHNFFHHLMHVPGKVERSGIHLDDLQAGATCEGNVFFKSAGKGIFMNGGAGHILVDNVFLEGFRGAYNVGAGSQRNYDRQEAILADAGHPNRTTKENYIGRAEKVVGERGWTRAPWSERYPLFREIMNDAGQFGRMWPIRCRIENNLYYGNTRRDHTIWSRVAPEAREKSTIENDRVITPDVFVDYERLDLRFRPGVSGMPVIPFREIGLRIDRYRRSRPSPTHYRGKIREFFDGIGSMPGTRRKIDSARLVEEGPRREEL